MTDTLSGRHALVTGAGSGIGAAIARRLHQMGASVSLAGRRVEPLARLAAELGERALALDGFDVTETTAIAAGLDRARAAFGPVAILVNNAGDGPSAPFEKTSLDMWNHVLAVDLTGVFLVTQAVLPDLKSVGHGARILTIASTAGLSGYAYVTAYCAAKHGVIGLTRALALELAKTPITVNAICPGFTDTPMVHRSVEMITAKTGKSEAEVIADLVRTNPQGRLIAPDEVADTVAWLVGDGAASMTGQSIAISGGGVMTG
jgi:NAD(P)-dependent dehydrogenase (short-subunit alcohol dehydrogenase family)